MGGGSTASCTGCGSTQCGSIPLPFPLTHSCPAQAPSPSVHPRDLLNNDELLPTWEQGVTVPQVLPASTGEAGRGTGTVLQLCSGEGGEGAMTGQASCSTGMALTSV